MSSDPKVVGDIGVMPRIGMNVFDLLLGKACGAIRGAHGCRSVPMLVANIAGRGVPSKVGHSVVCRGAVVVTSVIPGWTRPNERTQNKLMDAATVVSAKHDARVSVFAYCLRQYGSGHMTLRHAATCAYDSWKRSNAATIAHFILAIKARNWYPYFSHARIVSRMAQRCTDPVAFAIINASIEAS